MDQRLDVLKTYKLYIDGKFPRSESGRSVAIESSAGRVLGHVCRASRKDLREAVEAARRAQPAWQDATAYLRGQILYRIAEMVQGKRDELAELLDARQGSATAGRGARGRSAKSSARTRARSGRDEVDATVDRLVSFAGWADKYAQVLGCNNPVAGPHYNFTVPEPCGVVAAVAPDRPSLLGLVSLAAPALCAGNTVVCIASDFNPLPAAVLAEACATGDVPAGVINILTGVRTELAPFVAGHRDIDAVHAGDVDNETAALLRGGAAENIKRVTTRTGVDWFDAAACCSPWWIEPMIEMKTIWHPASA
ncbi:MAG: NAD/NADP-dependent betaine aldehyde dehydrogenase [Phycisphaerales bacterium]|nr:NAD/NADP-dependent betaine aldehyde dehydrogenase [Phycisphaerales bacterium]